jgi:hypothetical protein
MTRYEHFMAAAITAILTKSSLEPKAAAIAAEAYADEMEVICQDRDAEEIKRSNENYKKWAESKAGKKELAAIEKNMGANYVGTIASVSSTNRGNV